MEIPKSFRDYTVNKYKIAAQKYNNEFYFLRVDANIGYPVVNIHLPYNLIYRETFI